jgi:hypothetical protein
MRLFLEQQRGLPLSLLTRWQMGKAPKWVTGGRKARDQPRFGRSLAADMALLCDDVLNRAYLVKT